MRYVIGFSFAALAIWVVQTTGILTALLVFVAVGSVPGTAITVSPHVMLISLAIMTVAVGFWIKRIQFSHRMQNIEQKQTRQANESSKPAIFAAVYARAFATARQVASISKGRAAAGLRRLSDTSNKALATITAALRAAAKRIFDWARPRLNQLARQVIYSAKGTILSAHKWSSLSKKAWASVAPLLSRCSSLLKRGRSFAMRDARKSSQA